MGSNVHQRQIPGKAYAITHIHTDASNAEASELDPVIRAALDSIPGAEGRIKWAECFTPVSRLLALLQRGHGSNGPVHMVTVTDHMRRKAHRIPLGHMAAAAADHRLAIGGEIYTRTRDVDGVIRKGPEILAYGGVDPVQGPEGPYYGISATLLEELYDTCLDDEGQELDTRRAGCLLRRRGIAHGLSHPFDNHPLSLEGLFRVISEFPFLETVNGGYFAPSVRVLDAFIRLNNAILLGGELPSRALTSTGRRIVAHIRQRGRLLHPWGGSDAHSHDFDRVVVAMDLGADCRPEDLGPRDLFASMLAWERDGQNPRHAVSQPPSPFTVLGRPSTPTRQALDVTAIVLRNLRRAGILMLNPLIAPRVVYVSATVTHDELSSRIRAQKKRLRDLQEQFNPEALMAQLVMPESVRLPAPEPPRVGLVRRSMARASLRLARA